MRYRKRSLNPACLLLMSTLAVVAVFSCGQSTAPTGDAGVEPAGGPIPLSSTLNRELGPGPAIVRGIWVTDEYGTPLGEWGRPEHGGVFAYPNPCGTGCTIIFYLRQATEFTAWVERAYAPSDVPEGGSTYGGGAVPVTNREIIRMLSVQGKDAGRVSLEWDVRDEEGRPVADGFYRVVVVAEGEGAGFVDLLVSREHWGSPEEILGEG